MHLLIFLTNLVNQISFIFNFLFNFTIQWQLQKTKSSFDPINHEESVNCVLGIWTRGHRRWGMEWADKTT